MMGQAPAVLVVGPFTEQVEHLAKGKIDNKVVGGVRIGTSPFFGLPYGQAPTRHSS